MANVWSSCRLLEFDFSGIEQVVMGWCMNDPRYIGIAKRGTHAFVASGALAREKGSSWVQADITWPDEQLLPYLKSIKKSADQHVLDVYDQSKRCVHGCLAPDHEVLTPTGWIRIDQYVEGTPVAQWEHGTLAFVLPLAVTRTPCQNGYLWDYFGRSLSAVMTPDHRIPFQFHAGNQWKETTAETAPTQGKIPVGGILDGAETHATAFLQLVVAVQADASCGTGMAVFHLVKPRKLDRLRRLLAELDAEYSDVPCACHNGGRRICLNASLSNLVLAWLEGKEKRFHLQSFLRLTAACREVVVEELQYWDGHTKRKGGYLYFTSDRVQAERVQTLAATLGRQALLREQAGDAAGRFGTGPYYWVSFNTRRTAALASIARTKVPYEGLVYCLTVPSSYFLIRHRDRISVTGNTAYGLTTHGMVRNFPKIFPSIKIAEATQAAYFELAPGVPVFHQTVRQTAYDQHYLGGAATYQYLPDQRKVIGHPYGYQHWFWSVVSYKRLTEAQRIWRAKRKEPYTVINGIPYAEILGEDSKRVIALYPQSISRGVLTEACFPLFDPDDPLAPSCYVGDLYYGETPLRAPIHDSLFFECPTRKVDTLIERVAYAMQRPIEAMPCPLEWGLGAYLTVGVDAKIGDDWGSMAPLSLPSLTDLGVANDAPYTPAEEADEEDVEALEVRIA